MRFAPSTVAAHRIRSVSCYVTHLSNRTAGEQGTCRPDIHRVRVQTAEPGALDDVLPEVLPLLEAELWGDVADEREAGAFSGSCREAKKPRAHDTFQLLAQGTTFRTHIGPLLRPVRSPHS